MGLFPDPYQAEIITYNITVTNILETLMVKPEQVEDAPQEKPAEARSTDQDNNKPVTWSTPGDVYTS